MEAKALLEKMIQFIRETLKHSSQVLYFSMSSHSHMQWSQSLLKIWRKKVSRMLTTKLVNS
jgi:hypothetical protein